MRKKINFSFFLILILFFLPIKNSLAETNYSFTSTDSYYTTVAGYETYKIEYTPSSNITFKIGTYTSPVDTFINVFPKATANLSISPLDNQSGGDANDDDLTGFNNGFTQQVTGKCNLYESWCSYVEKSLVAGTTYIIYISELVTSYNLTTSATLVTSNVSDLTVDVQDPTTNKDVVGSIDSQSNISKNYAQQSINVVSGRLKYLRENVSNSNLSSKNIQLDFFGNTMLNSLSEAIQVANKSSKITTPKEWSSWSEGLLVLSKTGDNGNSSSFEVDTQRVAIGFDKKLNEKDSIGYAIQFAQSDSEIGSSGSSIDSENLNISFYRSNPLDNDNFIEGLIGFGLLENDLVRKSGSNILTGSRNGAQVFGSINFGKKIDKGDLTLTPVARLDLAYTELSAYSETGTDALSYSKQTIESGLASIGLEINDIIKFNNSSLKPFGSAEYSLDFSNSSDAKMNYTSDTSTTYTYKQGINSNHFISSEIGFEYMTSDKLNIIASYMRNQGNESQHSDQVKLQVNYRSKKETDYAMTLSGSGDLSTGFDISKNLNGFDLNFNANQSLNESSNRAAEVSLSRKF